MTEETRRYWARITKTQAMIHHSDCDSSLTIDGRARWENPRLDYWWGPYASLGAAIDFALLVSCQVSECSNCGTRRLNVPTQ